MSSRSEMARKIARCLAARKFRGHWDLKTILNDVESVAWELEGTAPPHVSPTSIAIVAVKRIRVGRQFRESIRSITTKKKDRRSKRPEFQQVHVHLSDIATRKTTPADLAGFWIDFRAWLARWDQRKRPIVEALAVGGKTNEVAAEFGVSEGRVSQLRRAFEKDWKTFQGVN